MKGIRIPWRIRLKWFLRGMNLFGAWVQMFDSPEEAEQRLQEDMREIERDAETIQEYNEALDD